MKTFWNEFAAWVGLLGVLIGVPIALYYVQKNTVAAEVLKVNAQRVITLTGVNINGVWTEEDVNGTNYWNKTFQAARPVLYAGETVLFRFESSDVTHSFYVPQLGIGPVYVEPGHVEVVEVTPTRAGTYTYYCTTVCGDCHYYMRGEMVVLEKDQIPPSQDISAQPMQTCNWHTVKRKSRPVFESRIEQGKWLINRMGCVTCHGLEGQGNISNPNYVKETVPKLNTLAEKMMLYEKEDVNKIIDYLERDVKLETLEEESIPRFNSVLAQYNSIRDVIKKGSKAGKLDANGPEPPLNMPLWSTLLSDEDIDAIIAYLLRIYPFEEEAK